MSNVKKVFGGWRGLLDRTKIWSDADLLAEWKRIRRRQKPRYRLMPMESVKKGNYIMAITFAGEWVEFKVVSDVERTNPKEFAPARITLERNDISKTFVFKYSQKFWVRVFG